MQHPFLTPSSVGSSRRSSPAPATTTTTTPWKNPPTTPRRIFETSRTATEPPFAPSPSSPIGEVPREEEATQVLLQRAEAAHSLALKEVSRLRQNATHLQAAKQRAEQLALDELERRKAAEASAKTRQKEVANERWRAEDAVRALRRLEVDYYDVEARSSAREREISRLELKCRRLEEAERLLAASSAKVAKAEEESERERTRADNAEERAREASAEVARLKREMKLNLDAEHERGEKAKEAIKARAERDRERARIAEINAAEKAQELLQLWQRFKILQSSAAAAPTSSENGEDRRGSGMSHNTNNNNNSVEDDDDAASAVTTLTQQDALRAKIDEARKGLKSSQRKLNERRQSGGSSS